MTLPDRQNNRRHLWRKTTSAAGLAGLRLHELRHFFASGLIASGCDVVTVQRALGYASATTTLHTYGHLWPDAEDRTRAATEGLMAASLDNLADHLRTERRRKALTYRYIVVYTLKRNVPCVIERS